MMSHTRKWLLAFATLILVIGGVVAVVLLKGPAADDGPPQQLSKLGPVYRYRDGNDLYRFHATFRSEALFDLVADPLEARDLARQRPKLTEEMRSKFLASLDLATLEEVPIEGEEMREKLESLGYIGGDS